MSAAHYEVRAAGTLAAGFPDYFGSFAIADGLLAASLGIIQGSL